MWRMGIVIQAWSVGIGLGVRKGAWRGGPDRLTGIDPEESTRSGWVESWGVAQEGTPQKIFK